MYETEQPKQLLPSFTTSFDTLGALTVSCSEIRYALAIAPTAPAFVRQTHRAVKC